MKIEATIGGFPEVTEAVKVWDGPYTLAVLVADCGSGCEPGDGPCFWDDAPEDSGSCFRHCMERVALDRAKPVVIQEAST